LDELTRFALIGDQFASVSKISSGYPYNDFALTHEPVRGDIYISVSETYAAARIPCNLPWRSTGSNL
jgi:conjugal transfer pilus assembly protein TraK